MAQAEFGNYRMDLVDGFRISASLRSGQGFNNNFYVYVCDRIKPPAVPNEFVKFENNGTYPKGKLVISGEGASYEFNDIQFVAAVVAANRAERYRIFEFHYPKETTDKGKTPATLNNSSNRKLNPAQMGDKLRYSIPGAGSAEYLLGESARIATNDRTVLTLSALRNRSNSFMQKLIALNDAAPNGNQIPKFSVECSDLKIDASDENLDIMFVEESYGSCLYWKSPTLSEYVGNPNDPWLVRVRIDSMTVSELLAVADLAGAAGEDASGRIIQTATFCFKQGSVLAPNFA